jgi:hypothetical protein
VAMGTISLEQEVFDNLKQATGEYAPFSTLEEARRFFGMDAWDKIVRLIDDNVEDDILDIRWGNDDMTERGFIKMGEFSPMTHDVLDGWEICLYSNNVLEICPMGSSGPGNLVINF